MAAPLPTAEELGRLPVRAVVAYAARTARRITLQLRGIVADEILDDALRLAESVTTTDLIAGLDPAPIISAAERVAAAYAEAPAGVQSPKKFFMVFSLIHTALAAMYAILAADDPSRARQNMKRAADDAQRAVRAIKALGSKDADSATDAARKDYEILLREYGQHEEVIIGEPVHCFDPDADKG